MPIQVGIHQTRRRVGADRWSAHLSSLQLDLLEVLDPLVAVGGLADARHRVVIQAINQAGLQAGFAGGVNSSTTSDRNTISPAGTPIACTMRR